LQPVSTAFKSKGGSAGRVGIPVDEGLVAIGEAELVNDGVGKGVYVIVEELVPVCELVVVAVAAAVEFCVGVVVAEVLTDGVEDRVQPIAGATAHSAYCRVLQRPG